MGALMGVLILLLGSLLLAASPPPTIVDPKPSVFVTIPWKTFSAMAKDPTRRETQAGVGACPSGEDVVVVTMLHHGHHWAYWWQPENRRIVWALWVNDKAGTPDALGFGVTDREASDVIPSLAWRPYDKAKDADGPCSYLVGPKKSDA